MYGVSLIHVDNSAIQEAIKNKEHPDTIAKLKGYVAYNCVVGFEYHEVEFSDLSNLLSSDIGFNNFKFRDVSIALYDKEKHPHAYGLIRGVGNIDGGTNWLWFDIDVTTITDAEMHVILTTTNHHIARTSDPDKPYKYRVLIELDRVITVSRAEWKFFLQAVATQLGLGTIDRLAMSQVCFGYKGRDVLSVIDQHKVNPLTALSIARTKVTEQEEALEQYAIEPGMADAALASPFMTFDFAYNAQVGNRWATSMAAIEKAKRLGASREYIKDLMYKINDFLDVPKARSLVEASLFSAI